VIWRVCAGSEAHCMPPARGVRFTCRDYPTRGYDRRQGMVKARLKPMPNILTINGGSSSVRFAIFEPNEPPRRLLQGKSTASAGPTRA